MAKECSTCYRPILWVITPKGRRMPLDAAPVKDGPWALIDGATIPGGNPRARAATEGDTFRYTSHFATCPQAKQHSRGGKATPAGSGPEVQCPSCGARFHPESR